MSKSRYLFRIYTLDSDHPVAGTKMNYSEEVYIDKKQFSIGSGSEADFKVKGQEVEPIHIGIKLDGAKIFLRNFSSKHTMISSYNIPPEKTEPYTPGEAIRLGKSKFIIFIELFRKFVDPHSESESIIREAWEKAKETETAVEEKRQALALLSKQTESLKSDTEKEVVRLIEAAKTKATEIEQSALKAKEDLLQESKRELEIAAGKAAKEIERKLSELDLLAEEKNRKIIDEARQKSKEIKQETENEIEQERAKSQRNADLLIQNAKAQSHEIIESSRRESESLKLQNQQILLEIEKNQVEQKTALEKINLTQMKISEFEGTKNQLQMEFDLEKERIRIASENLQKQVDLKESEKRAIEAKIEEFTAHYNQITEQLETAQSSAQKELERCNIEAKNALSQRNLVVQESAKIETKIEELKSEFLQLQKEHAEIQHRVSDLKTLENKERDKMREKLNNEYDSRKQLEIQWQSQVRAVEIQTFEKEKLAKEKLEFERLEQQAHNIYQSVQPQLQIEIVAQIGQDQSQALRSKLDQLLQTIIHRSVVEEYEFRRKHWQNVELYSYSQKMREKMKVVKKQWGLTLTSLLLLIAALLISWSKHSGLQIAYLTLIPESSNNLASPNSGTPPNQSTEREPSATTK